MLYSNAAAKVIIHKSRSEHFYGTEIKIWAGLGLVGNTEKNGAHYEQLLRALLSCFHGQNNLFFK